MHQWLVPWLLAACGGGVGAPEVTRPEAARSPNPGIGVIVRSAPEWVAAPVAPGDSLDAAERLWQDAAALKAAGHVDQAHARFAGARAMLERLTRARARKVMLVGAAFHAWHGSTAFFNVQLDADAALLGLEIRSGDDGPVIGLETVFFANELVAANRLGPVITSDSDGLALTASPLDAPLRLKGFGASITPAGDRVVSFGAKFLSVRDVRGGYVALRLDLDSTVRRGDIVAQGAQFTSFGFARSGAVLVDLVRGKALLDVPDAMASAASPRLKTFAALKFEDSGTEGEAPRTWIDVWTSPRFDAPRRVELGPYPNLGRLALRFDSERNLGIDLEESRSDAWVERLWNVDVSRKALRATRSTTRGTSNPMVQWHALERSLGPLETGKRRLVAPELRHPYSVQSFARARDGRIVALVDAADCAGNPCALGVVIADARTKRLLGRVHLPTDHSEGWPSNSISVDMAPDGASVLVRHDDESALVSTHRLQAAKVDAVGWAGSSAFDPTGSFLVTQTTIRERNGRATAIPFLSGAPQEACLVGHVLAPVDICSAFEP